MSKFLQIVLSAVDLVKRIFNYLRSNEPQVELWVIGLLELFIVCNINVILNINFYF